MRVEGVYRLTYGDHEMKLRIKENILPILSYGLFVMTITHTLTHAFGNMHTSLFPILQQEFSLSYQQLGLIAAIPPLCQTILYIPAGILSDKFGSKKMTLFSMVIACAGAITASIAQDMWVLTAAISLLYINTTFYHPPSYSLVSRLFQPKDRSKALGLHGAGGTFGMAIGPISISILMGVFAFGWRQIYLFWSIPMFIGVILVFFIKSVPKEDMEIKTDSSPEQSQATKLFTISLVAFLVFNGIRNFAGSMSTAFLSVYLVSGRDWTLEMASLIIGMSLLMGIIAAPLGGFITGRFGEKRWILMTLAVSSICYGVAFLMPDTMTFVLFYLSYGFFNYLSMAAGSALMARLSPSRQRGLGYALYFLPGSIGAAIAPMIGAYIADSFGLINIFVASTLIFMSSLIMLQFGVKEGKRHEIL
jgi:MFS family permease